jgi:UPF0755 protein
MLQLLASGKEAQFRCALSKGCAERLPETAARCAVYQAHAEDDSYATVAKALKLEHPDWVEGWFWPDTWMYTANTTMSPSSSGASENGRRSRCRLGRADGNLPYADQNQL